jgi:hypothetical protein
MDVAVDIIETPRVRREVADWEGGLAILAF